MTNWRDLFHSRKIFPTKMSGYISTFKNLVSKVESVLHLLGILSDDMVLVDLLKPAADILMQDVEDEIIDGLARYLYLPQTYGAYAF